ncbi:MAG TPA: histidine kinase [Ginsengibacter sp.]|nr:histidine kinase [Ginsengibacter sp.]
MEYDNDRPVKPVYKTEIFYWILIFLFYPLINFFTFFYRDIVFLPIVLLISLLTFPFYFIYANAVIPWAITKKRFVWLSITGFGFYIVVLTFLWFIYSFVHLDENPLKLLQSFQSYFNFSPVTVARESLWIFVNLTFATSIAFLKQHFYEENLIAALQKDNINFKVKYLRSQLNPHFLFNTLNSIYSLSLQKSDKTPDVVVKLSDLMRYMIYDCDEEKIELNKEIEFIRNYIEIEKIRYNADVRFTVEGDTEGIMIEPFLFISFIENGFKHAFNNSYNDAFIYVTIKASPGQIVLNVINNTDIDLETQSKKIFGTGIRNSKSLLELVYPDSYALDIIQTDKEEQRKSDLRITNAKKRLEVLYPDSHTLDVILSKNAYTVSLIIKLDPLDKMHHS